MTQQQQDHSETETSPLLETKEPNVAITAITSTTAGASSNNDDGTSDTSDMQPVQDAIEAVDVTTPTSLNGKTTGCGGNCFKAGKKCKKRWINNSDKNTPQMSEVYCPTCDDFANETPACLNKMPDKKSKIKPKTILSVESELVIGKRGSLKFTDRKPISNISRSSSLTTADRKIKKPEIVNVKQKDKAKTKDKEKEKDKDKDLNRVKEKSSRTSLLAKVSPKKLRAQRSSLPSSTTISATTGATNGKSKSLIPKKKENINNNGETKVKTTLTQESKTTDTDSCQEYEIADDAISLNGGDISQVSDNGGKMLILTETDSMITVRGKEELPVVEEPSPLSPVSPSHALNEDAKFEVKSPTQSMYQFEKCVRVPVTADSHPLQPTNNTTEDVMNPHETTTEINVNVAIDAFDNNSSNSSTTITHNESPSKRPSTLNDCNGNLNSASCSASPTSPPVLLGVGNAGDGVTNMASTLPRTKRLAAMQAFYSKAMHLVPKRRTPDGTNIYYWCDLPKKALQGEAIGCC